MTTKQRVRKAVMPVAGLGTRFLPVTKAMPKEMLPIVDVPTVQLNVEECVKSGIEEIIFVTARGKQSIEEVWYYNCIDCMVTYEIMEKQEPELATDPKMVEAFRFDMSKLRPLWEMSKFGVRINTDKVASTLAKAKHDEKEAQFVLNEMAEAYGMDLKGADLNVKSKPQMIDFAQCGKYSKNSPPSTTAAITLCMS